MRKRIAHQKPTSSKYNHQSMNMPGFPLACPLLTAKILRTRNECGKMIANFQKKRIDRILDGKLYAKNGLTRDSIRYQQLTKDCNSVVLINKYYSWQEIRSHFTHIISRNSIQNRVTFVDFKKDNYLITAKYARQLKRLKSVSPKHQSTLTNLSHNNRSDILCEDLAIKNINSFQIYQQQEINSQSSFYQKLAKSLRQMLKGVTNKKTKVSPEDSSEKKRYHKSPPNTPVYLNQMPLQSSAYYSLDPALKNNSFSNKNLINNQKSRPLLPSNKKLYTQYIQADYRVETQYDTQRIKSRSKIFTNTNRLKRNNDGNISKDASINKLSKAIFRQKQSLLDLKNKKDTISGIRIQQRKECK